MRNSYKKTSRFTLVCVALLTLSACTASKPFLIELPAGFESTARSITVKTPNKRFRSKHFDVGLGEYQIVKSRIKPFDSDNKRFSIAKDEYKDTWLDIILDGKLLPETTQYESFGKASSRDYRFEIAKNNETRVRSNCSLTQSVVLLEESTKSIFGTTKKNSATRRFDNEQWMQILYSCDIRTDDELTKLTVMHNRGKKPVYIFESETQQYQLAPMYNMISPYYQRYEDEPTVSDQTTQIMDAPAKLSGVTFLREKQPVAVVSLVPWSNIIWLDNSLAAKETELLLGISHSLILSSWMTD